MKSDARVCTIQDERHYLPLKANISAGTFLPCQFTVTVIPSFKSILFSMIRRLGAISVIFSSQKKNRALQGSLIVSLHNCLKVKAISDRTMSNRDSLSNSNWSYVRNTYETVREKRFIPRMPNEEDRKSSFLIGVIEFVL